MSMKCASEPSEYRNCILRASVRTGRNFSPARNVLSITAPSSTRFSFERTIAPALVGGSRLLYALLGAAYGLLAAAIFLLAGRRQRSVDRALASGDYAGLSPGWVMTFSFIGGVLALATIVAIVFNT